MHVGRAWSQLFRIRRRAGCRKAIRGGSSWRHMRIGSSTAADGASCQRDSRRGIQCMHGSGSGDRRTCWTRSELCSALSHQLQSLPKWQSHVGNYNCSTNPRCSPFRCAFAPLRAADLCRTWHIRPALQPEGRRLTCFGAAIEPWTSRSHPVRVRPEISLVIRRYIAARRDDRIDLRTILVREADL